MDQIFGLFYISQGRDGELEVAIVNRSLGVWVMPRNLEGPNCAEQILREGDYLKSPTDFSWLRVNLI